MVYKLYFSNNPDVIHSITNLKKSIQFIYSEYISALFQSQIKDYIQYMDSSIFEFVEPGNPGGNYREVRKEERKGASSLNHLNRY